MPACKGCGYETDEDVLEWGFCPGCADDHLCAQCKRECDPSHGLCDDCDAAEREALDLDLEP